MVSILDVHNNSKILPVQQHVSVCLLKNYFVDSSFSQQDVGIDYRHDSHKNAETEAHGVEIQLGVAGVGLQSVHHAAKHVWTYKLHHTVE